LLISVADRPEDFSVLYEWQEGSLPPPYHYEMAMRISPDGQGEVTLVPDYPSGQVPVFSEPFPVSARALDGLFRLMIENGLLETSWQAQEDPPVGGEVEWLTVTAGGRQVEIPAFVLPEQQSQVKAMAEALRALVPAETWERLQILKDKYIHEYPG
jgi:hypothetical protein